jgi:UDP-MurNAc hydroxylase
MPSEIVWINHAGYELKAGGLKIVHDPWLVGLAFDNGWSLYAPTQYKAEDFADVDYIWFSHEHPDHFSIPSIKAIPNDIRSGITVLFQHTKDKRVVDFCKRAGFKTMELEDGKRYALNKTVAITCGKVGRDSWLYTETEDGAIFNANDCVGVDWNEIAKSLPTRPEILLTQFSFANWVGNPGENDKMGLAAKKKIIEMRAQLAAFDPGCIIPFASFIWFCSRRNFHQNQYANTIDEIATLFNKEIPVVILYPGDQYVVGEQNDNSNAIARYNRDWDMINGPLDLEEAKFSIDELCKLANAEQKRLRNENWLWLLKPLHWLKFIEPVSVYLDDLNQGIRYSMFGGILSTSVDRS